MKYLTLLGLLCLFTGTALVAQSADEAAIKAAIEQESEAIDQRDFATWQSFWQQDENTSLVSIHDNWDLRGWEAVQQQVKDFFDKSPEPPTVTGSIGNYMIDVQGDRAYVHYEVTVVSPYTIGGEAIMKTKYYTTHQMVKVDGQWKNSHVFAAQTISELDRSNIVIRLVQASTMLNRMDRTENATKIAETIAEIFPDLPHGYWGMGYYAFLQKDKAVALKHLEKAASLFDDGAPADLTGLIEAVKKLE